MGGLTRYGVIGLLLSISAAAACGQAATPVLTSQRRSAASQAASRPRTFDVHATLGPALQVPAREYLPRGTAQGPAWDGVNNGLWILLGSRDHPGAVAVLVDPETGRKIRQLPVPEGWLLGPDSEGWLLGHDGVGLWFGQREDMKTVYRRVRTAQNLPLEQRARRPGASGGCTSAVGL